MADFLSPSAAPVQPMSQAVEERSYPEPRPRPKRRAPGEASAPAQETEADPAQDEQPKHTLDIDA